MAQGIQVFNPAGQLVFDTGDRLSRIFGTVVVPVSGPGSSGSIALPAGYGNYWFFLWPITSGSKYAPSVSFSGNTMTWVPATLWLPAVECTILYGAY